jgi:hypothetical protein
MEDSDLKKAFDTAFIAASDRHRWKSSRGRSHWAMEASMWKDAIAGPLWSILKDGGCPYVYPRQDHYFAGVHDPQSLRTRLFEWHAKLAVKVEDFAPTSNAENHDLQFMQSLVADIRVVIERAVEMECQRWETSHQT